MLAKTLQILIDDNLTTAKEIGELSGVSTSTVYRWISGQSQPDYDSIRLLVRHLPNRKAQEAILASFSAGTSWQFEHMELELDVNDDGRIDVDDALDAAIKMMRGSAETLTQLRAAQNGETMDSEKTLQQIALLNQVARNCTITQRVLVDMAEQKRKRKLRLVERI
ncbi:helix-turn-helix domain-containing protein [Poriferisphaera sp. WC338]|uniref:helix-turn-helix domain-containing protein n=1 Tax=Poriferisphaera sp. WC338 TaxID=3425129 RepID=UPI003D8153FA